MSTTTSIPRLYNDFSWSFTSHPVTKDLVKVTGENAVKQSIKSLVLTRFFERPFDFSIGSGINSLLFTNFTNLTSQRIKNEIESVLNKFEPRCNLINIDIKEYKNENAISIEITFSILNSTKPLTVDVLIEKIR